MKFRFLVAALFITTIFFSDLHAVGIETGADIGYFSPKLTAPSYPTLTTSQATAFAGPLYTGYGHLTISVPNLLLIGIGGTLAFSNQSTVDSVAGATKEDMTISRFGLESKIQLELIPYLSPYVRLTLGKDWVGWTDTGTVGTSSYIAKSSAGGLFYTALLGVQFPLSPEFALYVQGGYTASPGSVLVTKSYAVAGLNQAITTAASTEVSYSGLIVSAGGRLAF